MCIRDSGESAQCRNGLLKFINHLDNIDIQFLKFCLLNFLLISTYIKNFLHKKTPYIVGSTSVTIITVHTPNC